MKRKVLLLGFSMVFVISALTGCGVSAEDYVNDMEQFATLNEMETESEDFEEMMEEMILAIDDLDIATPEGEEIQDDLSALMGYTMKMVGDKEIYDLPEGEMEIVQEEMDELSDLVEKDVDEF